LTPSVVRDRIFFASLLAVVEEGNVAGYLSWSSQGSARIAIATGFESACFLALPVFVLAASLALLLGTEAARGLWRHVRMGLSGDRPELEDLGVFLYSAALATAACLSWRIALRVSDFQSARVATLVAMVTAIVFALGAAPLVAATVPVLGKLARFAQAREGFAWLPLADIEVAAVGVGAMFVLLPSLYVNSPSAFLVGFALGPTLARVGFLRRAARAPGGLLLVASAALSGGAALGFEHTPGLVQLGVAARSPYASLVVTNVRRAFDHDGDGYAPVLGGGDCDDRDPLRHPGAVDVPENGIDENCSGVDARRYLPPVAPSASSGPSDPPIRHNVVLVHVDALRPDHVSFTGYGRATTPHLDGFREHATWFKNAYTPAPSTRFALSALMTGREIERIPQTRGTENDFLLRPEAMTLAERLEPAGYDRVGYTLSFVLDHIHEVGQGFRIWTTPWLRQNWEAAHKVSAKLTTDAAIQYLASVPPGADKPFLLFVHYDCTHDPYLKHAPWDYGERDVDLYDSALHYCDQEVGRLFSTLDSRSDKDKTATIVYSDHGELFGEHGYTNHGNTLYEPDVRILLLAKVPGATASEIDTPMILTDVYPTVLALAGAAPDPECEAWNLMPYLAGAPMPSRPLFFYADLHRNGIHFEWRAVLDAGGRLKLIRNVSLGQNELYDVGEDAGERVDLGDRRPEVRDSLLALLEGWDAHERAGF
jgi:arylsulfatase A-like enzyme